ncbi:MAG TPA: hypothetical protein VIV58_08170 [Kofleriaceae bacterium]
MKHCLLLLALLACHKDNSTPPSTGSAAPAMPAPAVGSGAGSNGLTVKTEGDQVVVSGSNGVAVKINGDVGVTANSPAAFMGCAGGKCDQPCPAKGNCSATCAGGGCTQTCSAGAECDFECEGGRCTQKCEPGAKCTLACGGGTCPQQCDGCEKTCKGDHCS